MKIRDWYFQGWERREDENGKKALVYTGEYYSFPRGASVKPPAGIMAASLTAVYLFVALLPPEGGMWHYAAIPQLLELIPILYLIMGAARLLRVRDPMTFRDWYASWRRMKHASAWSVGFTAAMVLAEIAFLAFVGAEKILPELAYLLGELICAALSVSLFRYIDRHPFSVSAERADKE